ncbi:hypothetical protein SA496_01285 [Pseudomonas sp. JS3066]|uniref:hypothetical protein n=1 Tax=Pseudomonas sp. JS3066 TaxID=3090665 RepID=UPI002E7ADBB5|nr:hypothetical protein [Pseudomonas sp. JS3066]WVK93849.1 hypothetical protein SA496_01285 [Pseudomonas sp. JS3066]
MSDTTLTAEAFVLVVEPVTAPVLVEGGEDCVITLEQTETVVIGAGEQGPPGPQGIPGPAGGSSLQRQAGEVLSALRVLYELDGAVFALDYRDETHIDLLLGLSLTAADAGQPLNVQRSGVIEDAGWSWQPGRIWLGADGQLTQTPPVDGFDVLIGAAVSATRITLNIQDPIEQE